MKHVCSLLMVFTLTLTACSNSGSTDLNTGPFSQTPAAGPTTPETYESPFSKYSINLSQLIAMSKLTTGQMIAKFQEENINIVFVGDKNQNRGLGLKESELFALEENFATNRATLARYFPPHAYIEKANRVEKRPVLGNRPFVSEPVIAVRPYQVTSAVLIHEYAHHLFLGKRSERQKIWDGLPVEERTYQSTDTITKIYQREALEKNITEKSTNEEKLPWARLHFQTEIASVKHTLISALDELDVLGLQIKHRQELGLSASEHSDVRNYFAYKCKSLSAAIKESKDSQQTGHARYVTEQTNDPEAKKLMEALMDQLKEASRINNLAVDFYNSN